GGQCTFVSDNGRRCPARTLLEFDHVEEVARGGRATVAGVRLRCRAHNQYGAECTFGADFMRHKREAARRTAETHRQETAARAVARAAAAEHEAARREAAREAAAARARAEEVRTRAAAAAERARAAAAEVIPWLRRLGFRADEARRAATRCESVPDASLEERVRVALSCFAKAPQAGAARTLPAPTLPA
ncbi:MAG: hypothetical protein HZC42_13530, partial [Candidatus Eisenbacteria bacterium]|nr:hypothetical protein [Candidatus Eisenbacteria bacterium]